MTTQTWQVNIDGKTHNIILKYGLIHGRKIWLDGQLLLNGKRIVFDYGTEHHFMINSYPVELGIVSNTTGHEFYVLVDDIIHLPNENKKQVIGKKTKAKLDIRKEWVDLGKSLDIEYHPFETKNYVFQHRLIGFIKGFLVQIVPGFKHVGEASLPGTYVFLRHFEIDSEKVKLIKSDEMIKGFLKEIKSPDALEINPSFTTLFIRSTSVQTETIREVINIISPYLQSLSPEKCQGLECKQRIGQDLKLTLINGIPYLMCQNCINGISDIAKRTEENYRSAPSNLFRGALFGASGATIGAIIWALVYVFLDRIGAAFGVLILLLVIKSMDFAKTKRSLFSVLLAGLLSLGGAVLGTYLGILGYLWKENKLFFEWSEFIRIAQIMFDDPEILRTPILFALIGIVPFAFITWNSQRKYLKNLFMPDVEIIQNFQKLESQ
ncbi:MAG TPA: hypothetical protein PK152_02095 [Anaerolineales bacterium]|nr:hypothetical protein [Anaerolineales bacterium]